MVSWNFPGATLTLHRFFLLSMNMVCTYMLCVWDNLSCLYVLRFPGCSHSFEKCPQSYFCCWTSFDHFVADRVCGSLITLGVVKQLPIKIFFWQTSQKCNATIIMLAREAERRRLYNNMLLRIIPIKLCPVAVSFILQLPAQSRRRFRTRTFRN